jgi:hypothetical protein
MVSPELLTEPLYTSVPPTGTGVGGQVLVTLMLGVFTSGQIAVAVAVTWLPEQRPWPRAVRVSTMSQQYSGAV